MARDLIPPPSPGRPEREQTEPHRFVELPHEAPPVGEPRLSLSPTQYRDRIGFLTGALGGLVVASVALAVALFAWGADGDRGMHPHWSVWQPDDESLAEGSAQIARYVGAQYKGADGTQLVSVKAGAENTPVTLHANVVTDLTGDTVVYQLAGFGKDGSIEGEVSVERGAVVFREALELALYSFRYLPDADGVMVLVPPPPAEANARSRNRAIYFRPGDLKSELRVPLVATIPGIAPSAATISPYEVDTILQRIRSNLFTWEQNQTTGEITLEPMAIDP